MSRPRFLVFSGSLRSGSFNTRLAELVARQLAEAGGDVSAISLADFPMPIYDGNHEMAQGVPETARALKQLMQQHQGVFIACPEYNAAIPPLLKNTIDWVSRVAEHGEQRMAAFKGRVFAIGSASSSPYGGVRGLSNLRLVLETGVGAQVIPEMIAVPTAAEAFDETGELHIGRYAASTAALVKTLYAEASLRLA